MKPPLSHVPLLPVLAAFVVGDALSKVAGDDSWLWILAILFITAAIFIKGRKLLAVMVLSIAFGLGVADVDTYVHRAIAPDSGRYRFKGVVESVGRGDCQQHVIVSLSDGYRGRCLVTIDSFEPELHMGDIVAFCAEIYTATPRLDVTGDRDLTDYYYNRYIERTARVMHDSIQVVGRKTGLLWSVRRYRDVLVDATVRTGLSDRSQAFVAALLLGDDSMMSNDTRTQFSSSGIVHVLALSGMHVAVIAGILSFVLLPVAWLGYRRWRWITVIALLWLYAVLTGLSPSVLRAVIMFSVILMAKCLGRNHSTINSLLFAALVILVAQPRLLFAPSFQLSFMAVLSLVTVPEVVPAISTDNRFLRTAVNYLVYTLSAVIGTMPLVMYYFHSIPVYFLLANIPCALLLPPILVLAIITVSFQVFYVDCQICDHILNVMCETIMNLASFFAQLPDSTIVTKGIPWYGVIIVYLILAAVTLSIYLRNKYYVIASLSALIIFIFLALPRDNKKEVLFIGRSRDATDIVYTVESRAYVITTGQKGLYDDVVDRVTERYCRFFEGHGVDTVIQAADGRRNHMLTFGEYRLAVVNNGGITDSIGQKVEYLIVGAGFKGDIVELTRFINCDTLLLGTDINRRRRKRYLNEANAAGVNVRDLGDPYGLVLENRTD